MRNLWGVLVIVLAASTAVQGEALVSSFMKNLFKSKFYTLFETLYIKEGDSSYPFPATSAINADLIPTGLRGVKGVALKTDPGTTVSEGQGYAMFAAAMAGDIETLKGLTVGWQAMTQGYAGGTMLGGCSAVGSRGICLCNTITGADMPAWRFPLSNCAGGCTGSAPDGDEDAIVGIIYLAELTNDDSIRELAVKSIAAFVEADIGGGVLGYWKNSRPVPVKGDIPEKHQRIFLWRGGSCWGGYDTSSGDLNRDLCIAPAYFSPGQWRLFMKYVQKYKQYVPTSAGYTADNLTQVLDASIVWSYNTLARIACESGIVSNWWSLYDDDSKWPWQGYLHCANSGTTAGEYGPDACRMPWRVALDAMWFGDDASVAPYYTEQGKISGYWGAPNYTWRWTRQYRKQLTAASSSCPTLACLREDQVFPMLSVFPKCDTCPGGFTASPWNAWGYMPVASAFAVTDPQIGTDQSQKWLELMTSYLETHAYPDQYFDKGLEVICSGIMGGFAPYPLGDITPSPCSLPTLPSGATGAGTCASSVTSGASCHYTCGSGLTAVDGKCLDGSWSPEPSCKSGSVASSSTPAKSSAVPGISSSTKAQSSSTQQQSSTQQPSQQQSSTAPVSQCSITKPTGNDGWGTCLPTIASGKSCIFKCVTGYVATAGVCEDGSWNPKPTCQKTSASASFKPLAGLVAAVAVLLAAF